MSRRKHRGAPKVGWDRECLFVHHLTRFGGHFEADLASSRHGQLIKMDRCHAVGFELDRFRIAHGLSIGIAFQSDRYVALHSCVVKPCRRLDLI